MTQPWLESNHQPPKLRADAIITMLLGLVKVLVETWWKRLASICKYVFFFREPVCTSMDGINRTMRIANGYGKQGEAVSDVNPSSEQKKQRPFEVPFCGSDEGLTPETSASPGFPRRLAYGSSTSCWFNSSFYLSSDVTICPSVVFIPHSFNFRCKRRNTWTAFHELEESCCRFSVK